MGTSHSKKIASNPISYATAVPANDIRADGGEEYRTYDYVIVGGGTAGCVLASRLSEDPNITVLLLECGKSNENVLLSRVPIGFFQMFRGPYDWLTMTTPQPRLDGRPVYWPRGRLLGGSSSMNALMYHHCAPEDFDSWEKQGAVGWGYETMRKYFRKAEKYNAQQDDPVDTSLHGDSGPWLTRAVPVLPIANHAAEAAANLGVPRSEDLNTPEGTIGTFAFTGFMDQQNERSSAATAYLTKTVLERPNLTVAVEIMAEKILFKSESNGKPRACGVQLIARRSGPRYRVTAAKEVIVCAGAIGSPQVLMLSGVGPRDHLEKLGISVTQDLPAVGSNLYDHFSAGGLILRAKPGLTLDYLSNPLNGALALLRWMIWRTGPMVTLACPVGIFFRADNESLPLGPTGAPVPRTVDHSAGPGAPDVEIVVAVSAVVNNGFTKTPAGTNGLTVGPVVLKPESSGTVRLRSSDIWDQPLVDPNYLASDNDAKILIKGFRFILALAHAEPLASDLDIKYLDSPPLDAFWPSNVDPNTVTDEDIRTWIRKHGQSAWHYTSSVRMGTSPTDSAVDPQLQVHGVEGLRVADASVFPNQLSGHPTAPIIAIAERLADLIKGLS